MLLGELRSHVTQDTAKKTNKRKTTKKEKTKRRAGFAPLDHKFADP